VYLCKKRPSNKNLLLKIDCVIKNQIHRKAFRHTAESSLQKSDKLGLQKGINNSVKKKVNFINSSQNEGLSPSCIAQCGSISWNSI
jgi:hypothetical protein